MYVLPKGQRCLFFKFGIKKTKYAISLSASREIHLHSKNFKNENADVAKFSAYTNNIIKCIKRKYTENFQKSCAPLILEASVLPASRNMLTLMLLPGPSIVQSLKHNHQVSGFKKGIGTKHQKVGADE